MSCLFEIEYQYKHERVFFRRSGSSRSRRKTSMWRLAGERCYPRLPKDRLPPTGGNQVLIGQRTAVLDDFPAANCPAGRTPPDGSGRTYQAREKRRGKNHSSPAILRGKGAMLATTWADKKRNPARQAGQTGRRSQAAHPEQPPWLEKASLHGGCTGRGRRAVRSGSVAFSAGYFSPCFTKRTIRPAAGVTGQSGTIVPESSGHRV